MATDFLLLYCALRRISSSLRSPICFTVVSVFSTLASGAEVPPPPLDAAKIYQRLESQDAEIIRLRQRLMELESAADQPMPELLPPPGSQRDEPSLRPDSSAGLGDVLRRLETLESSLKKPEQPSIDRQHWTDVSAEKWTIKLGGQIFIDNVDWADASPSIVGDQNYLNFRRIRLQADGAGYGVYDFRVQLDFEPDNDTTNNVTEPYVAMKDIYLTMNELPGNGRLRFGHFFVPFALEQLTPLPNNMFMERSIPTTVFGPEREIGMACYRVSDDQNATIALGVFYDDIPESTKEVVDDNQGLRLSARGTWLPYFDEPSNGRYLIHTGAGFVFTQPRDGESRFRARPGELRETPRLIDTGILPTDSFSVANIELAVVWGPLSLQSEMFGNHVDLAGNGGANLYGSYLQGSYFLTGENRKYDRVGRHLAHFGRVTPFTNFFIVPGGTGWGAWEAKARWEYLDFGEVDRGLYNDFTAGMNWYWTEHARLMFDWVHPWTSADTVFGKTQSDLLAMRLQFTF